MLVSQRYCKTTDDAGENVKELSCTVELVGFMDQRVEAFIDCLSDHFSSRDKL